MSWWPRIARKDNFLAELAVFSAFLVGLLGGVHCAAMCGGIVGAISFRNCAVTVRGAPATARPIYHLAYNAGRIGSYTIAGTIAGLIGSVGCCSTTYSPPGLSFTYWRA